MRYLLGILLVVAAFAAVSEPARADSCGLPDAKPLWVDYGAPQLLPVFGRSGVVVAGSGAEYPTAARAAGAKTVYWDMYLSTRVGTPSAPADPDVLPARAQKVFDFAVLSAACATPVIAMNELFGAATPTPWTPTTARYRANVLEWARLLSARGGRPVLLVSSEPYTSGEAAQWWRDLAGVADIALEKYFNAPAVHKAGSVLGSRRMRTSMRRSAAKLFAIGVPPSKVGLVLAFQTRRGVGGREGLEPAGAWFEVAKLQALAAKQVARELGLGHVWSWGWGFFNEQAADPDKHGAACVWLWARDRSLCDVAAVREPFDPDLRAGQIDLPRGVRCALGREPITTNAIGELARVTGDAESALTALYERLVVRRSAFVGLNQALAREREIVERRFSGSTTAYRTALSRARATLAVARGAIADVLRREAIQQRLPVAVPSAGEIAEFYRTYATVPLGEIAGAGAVPGATPETLLGAIPPELARPAITRALQTASRADAYGRWTTRQQKAALAGIRCTNDRLPVPGAVDLRDWIPALGP